MVLIERLEEIKRLWYELELPLRQDVAYVYLDKEVFLQSWGLFKISSNLSFTDCSTIILAKEFSIKNAASFDSDFDRFNIKSMQK